MPEPAECTAICGLYCADCIPSNQAFFEAAARLEEMLDDLGFDHYAVLKAETIEAFRDYPAFRAVLSEIGRLRCPVPCIRGGCKPDCDVRTCAQARNYRGCWECSGFETCQLLEPLRRFHGSNINHNLAMIRKHGLDNWAEHRGRHYPWSRGD